MLVQRDEFGRRPHIESLNLYICHFVIFITSFSFTASLFLTNSLFLFVLGTIEATNEPCEQNKR